MSTPDQLQAVFDLMAGDYPTRVSQNPSMLRMRKRVWQLLRSLVGPGHKALELGCGTGDDTVWLLGRDCEVHALDVSAAMLAQARAALKRHTANAQVHFYHCDLRDVSRHVTTRNFDLVLANFGVVNTVARLSDVEQVCVAMLKPGGHVVLNLMGRLAWWDLLSKRRRRKGVLVNMGDERIQCFYPTLKDCTLAFKNFSVVGRYGLGVCLPPPRISARQPNWNRLWDRLEVWDERLGDRWPFYHLGDHVVLVLKKLEQKN